MFIVGRSPRLIVSTLIFWLLLTGCSPSDNMKANPVIIDKTLTVNKKGIKGSGRLFFNQALFGLNSKELYSLKAEFVHENSRLILHSHFSGFKSLDGIKVFFLREGENLTVKVGTPNRKEKNLYKEEKFFANNQELYFFIEVQNGIEDLIRIKIWNRYFNPTGHLKTTVSFISAQNLLADSFPERFYSKGQGLLWGLELDKIQLIEALRESGDRI